MRSVIGMMSGTSLDGVDAAWIRTDGVRVAHFGPGLTRAYTPELRQALRGLLDRAIGLSAEDPDLLHVTRWVTMEHVTAVRELLAQVPQAVELIGFHGQTILHDSAGRHHGGRRSWQIGDAALLARETGIAVVSDFRTADVQAGGQGAPLAPIYHAALARNLRKPVAVLNIGGVANVTFLTGDRDEALLACDTGPGNALLDDWALRHTGVPCDLDGRLALAGRVDEGILEALLADPFCRQPAPKSLDRLSFHAVLDCVAGLSAQDGAATLVAFTARTIAALPLPENPALWLVCGGGRRNPVLMQALRDVLPGEVAPVEQEGWDGDALEAQCFGFLAVRSVLGLPISFPGSTGVAEPLSGGSLTRP